MNREYTFKGTKSPWCKSKDLIHDQTYLARHIVRMVPDSMPEEEIQANAHLIAAAPELLEALLAVKRNFPSDVLSDQMNEDYDLIEAAIEKALNL